MGTAGRPPGFRNVSGMFPVGVGRPGGSGPSPHPGSTCSAGWGRGAGREGAGGPPNRFKEGAGPGPVRAGVGGEASGPRAQVGRTPVQSPGCPGGERKSRKCGPRGERAEGRRGRGGGGVAAPLSGALVGVGRVQGALLHLCALRPARVVGRWWGWPDEWPGVVSSRTFAALSGRRSPQPSGCRPPPAPRGPGLPGRAGAGGQGGLCGLVCPWESVGKSGT